MTHDVFEAAQQMARDLKSASFMTATFIRMAQRELEAGNYESAAMCLENAATWCLNVKKAAEKPAKKAAK